MRTNRELIVIMMALNSLVFLFLFLMSPMVMAICSASQPYSSTLVMSDQIFQSTSEMPTAISKWHEFSPSTKQEIRCINEPSRRTLRFWSTAYEQVIVSIEGESYTAISAPLGSSETAMIFSVVLPDGAVKPINTVGANLDLLYFNAGEKEVVISGWRLRYRLIAMKKLEPGVTYASMTYGVGIGVPDLGASYSYRLNSVRIQVNNASCTLKAPNNVRLQSVPVSDLAAINSVRQAATFDMTVSCPAAYTSYNVLYSVSDVNAPGNTTSMLTPESFTGAARGVKLQLLDNGIPLRFAPADAATAANNFGYMQAAGGFLVKQLAARYIRTESIVKPGVLKAGASIVLSYD